MQSDLAASAPFFIHTYAGEAPFNPQVNVLSNWGLNICF
jgi:hypothetical protein